MKSKIPVGSTAFVTVFLALGVLFLYSVQSAALAQSEADRMSQLEARIAKLEERLEKLERLLSTLTEVPKPEQASQRKLPVVGRGDWRIRENWDKIRTGMSFEQVAQVLGKATRIHMDSEDQGTWYYEGYVEEARTTVSGNIFFADRQVLLVRPPVY